tara:strand:- start:5030 stop:5695 length:666 start_codon:yes stop_codon:yes gene_type:complete
MAAPTKGNTTNSSSTPGSNFKNYTHNQNTGSNGLIVVQLSMTNSRTYSSCTYGGQSMTQLYQINRSGLGQRMAFFYLENPPTGSNTLRVNFNNSVWNGVSVHIRSFTDSSGIGASTRTGGQPSPHNGTLTVEQDSLIMITSCCVNVILTQQIPTGTNRTFTTHNVNRQVATGAITADAGHSAGAISLQATSGSGNLTLDRTEIKGLGGGGGTNNGNFFLVM